MCFFEVSGTYESNGNQANFTLSSDVIYGTTSIFDQPANPVNITVSTDSAHAAAETITAANGGTITATGADGTIFTLTVPANALLTDEAVTMTPISSVGGLLISGGLVAGVQLAPEGLRLFQIPMFSDDSQSRNWSQIGSFRRSCDLDVTNLES